MVWGRWTNKLYYHGKVTGVSDGKIHVQFDDGDRISHSFDDVGAVLTDVIPNPWNVPVGSRVIAAFSNRAHYFQGCVDQVDWMNPQVMMLIVLMIVKLTTMTRAITRDKSLSGDEAEEKVSFLFKNL